MLRRRSTTFCAIAAAAVTVLAYHAGAAPAAARTVAPTVAGVVTDAAGHPVAGAQVAMFAWPTAGPAATRLVRIASARTGPGGRYALAPDLAMLPPGYALPGGGANVEIGLFTASAMQSFSMTVAPPDTADAALPTVAVGGVRPGTVSVRLGRTTGTVTTTLAATTTVQPVALTHPAPAGAQARRSAPSDWNCDVTSWGAYLRPRPEKWVHAWGWRNAHVTVHEEVGSAHSLGVAAQTGSGGWSASGTAAIETTTAAGGTVGYGATSRLVYNSVSYRHATMTCEANPGSYRKAEVRPYRFADIILSGAPKIAGNTFYNCATKYRGTWTKTQGRNKTFGAGVSIPGVGSLSAQASFSRSTELSWHVTGFTHLCGDDDSWMYSTETGAHGRLSAPCRPSPGKPC